MLECNNRHAAFTCLRFAIRKTKSQEENAFHEKIRLKFKEVTSEVLHLEQNFVRCWNLDISKVDQNYLECFWNVVLQKDGEGQLDRSCEKWRSVTKSHGGAKCPTYSEREGVKLDWSHLVYELPFETRYWRRGREKKWREDEEEEVSSYWISLREREDTGSRTRKL